MARHYLSKTPEYKAWQNMRYRCLNPKNSAYGNYGGRGISICARWQDGFLNFLEDMGQKPAGTSLDRIDNDGGYWCGKCSECAQNNRPFNCKWATISEQANNRRTNILPFDPHKIDVRTQESICTFNKETNKWDVVWISKYR